jgi:hypothetical protein
MLSTTAKLRLLDFRTEKSAHITPFRPQRAVDALVRRHVRIITASGEVHVKTQNHTLIAIGLLRPPYVVEGSILLGSLFGYFF